jgi:hypothetical protein
MSVLYPLAIINTTPITSLVRMALYHRSIDVYPVGVETSEAADASGAKACSAAAENPVTQPEGEVPGGR